MKAFPHVLLSALLLVGVLGIGQAQINLNKAKDKLLGKKKEEPKKEQPANNKPDNTKAGKSLSIEQETYLMNFYKEITQECEAMVWREGVHEGYF